MPFREPLFLAEDDQPISTMADLLGQFIESATSSLHIAIYDFRLQDPAVARQIVSALADRADAGVEVRIAYDHRQEPKFSLGDDPAPHGTHEFLKKRFAGSKVSVRPVGRAASGPGAPSGRMPPEWNKVATEPIQGSKLMHSKYVIRDGHSPDAAVLMGSTNFTDDAWTKQDNNVLVFDSPQLCAYYENDFNELWARGDISNTGVGDFGTIAKDGLNADIAFSPGEGHRIDSEIANLIRGAHQTIHIASMLVTSDAILSALTTVLEAGRVRVTGIYDGPEMAASAKQMAKSASSSTKLAQLKQVEKALVAKSSKPYTPNGVHNFMHNKLVVADDVVLTGSHNFSLSAETNAENAVLVRDANLAALYRNYVERLVAKYSKKG
jgi:phosphatidylserine/phosphatidylglycerophosphate/cardiolipin synthase-like enzyme